MCLCGKGGGWGQRGHHKKTKKLGHCLGVAVPYCLEGAECFCLWFDFLYIAGRTLVLCL